MFIFKAEVGKVTIKPFQGSDHAVIPIIALVEGVLQASNSPRPEMITKDVLAKSVAFWNGRPVVIDHPEVRGATISVNSPEVLEAEEVGTIFNAKMKGNRLSLEAWINLAQVEGKEERITSTVNKVLEGDVIEISTGFFVDTVDKAGTFNNKRFSGVLSNIKPDHLALLSSDKGACSIKDGCGANRMNTDLKVNCENVPDCSCNTVAKKDELSMEALKSFAETFHTFFVKSHENIRAAIQVMFDELNKADAFSYVIDITETMVIFGTYEGLYQRTYKLADDGSVTLGEDIVKVRPETEFVPVKTNEVLNMEKTKLVEELVANAATQFTEDDKESLMACEEAFLDRLTPLTPDPIVKEVVKEVEAPKTAEAYIAAAPDGMKEVLKEGLRLHQVRREELLQVIKANKQNKFSDDDLAIFEMSTLGNLATLAETPDFRAQGAPRAVEKSTDAIAAAPEIFPINSVN